MSMANSKLTRANLLAQMATDDSVTTDLLADAERQFPDGRLSGDPPLAYLDDSEAPAYVLTNTKRGIGVGSKRNTVTPDADRGMVVLITADRVVCLVGQEADDQTYSIPHSAIAWVSPHTGLFANRLELRTPSRAYHCWVQRSASESLLTDVTDFIEKRSPEDPTPMAGDDDASVVTWRGTGV
jgi:hypothetical protein